MGDSKDGIGVNRIIFTIPTNNRGYRIFMQSRKMQVLKFIPFLPYNTFYEGV